MACPITVTITIGDYEAQMILDEAVVNGTKPCPSQLMMGIFNDLNITKFTYKRGKAAGTDTLSAVGTFNVDGVFQFSEPFILTVGSQTFTVEGSVFKSSNGIVSCSNAPAQEGGFVSAKFDTSKGTFSVAAKKISLPDYGDVPFDLSLFGILLGGIETVNLGDPFVGKRTMIIYENDNIGDLDQAGVITAMKASAATSTVNNTDYLINIRGTTFSMVKQSANLLALNPQPQNHTGWISANAYMFSDGINGAFLHTGKDPGPEDLSIGVSAWSRPAVVTGAQLAGQWDITWIFDDNLLDGMMDPFDTSNETLTITDLGNNQVQIANGGSISWVMDISGNTLVPASAIDPTIKHLLVVTDGHGIAISMIGAETMDPTDVSARIGLASRQP